MTTAPTRKKTAVVPVINAPMTVDAAPDERVVWLRDDQIPRQFGVFAWQKLGDGTFAPVVRVYDTMVRISEVQKIGIRMSWDTLQRLATAGFIKSNQPAPGTIFICIDSLMRHLEAAEDPEFWTPERRRQYALGRR